MTSGILSETPKLELVDVLSRNIPENPDAGTLDPLANHPSLQFVILRGVPHSVANALAETIKSAPLPFRSLTDLRVQLTDVLGGDAFIESITTLTTLEHLELKVVNNEPTDIAGLPQIDSTALLKLSRLCHLKSLEISVGEPRRFSFQREEYNAVSFQYLTSHLTSCELFSLLAPLEQLVTLNMNVTNMFHPEDRVPLEGVLGLLPNLKTLHLGAVVIIPPRSTAPAGSSAPGQLQRYPNLTSLTVSGIYDVGFNLTCKTHPPGNHLGNVHLPHVHAAAEDLLYLLPNAETKLRGDSTVDQRFAREVIRRCDALRDGSARSGDGEERSTRRGWIEAPEVSCLRRRSV